MGYNKGETIVFDVEIRNYLTNALFDPSSISVSIISKEGTVKVNEAAMTKSSTGIYTYSWTADKEGTYKVVYKAIDGTKITNKKDLIKVINI